MSGKGKAAGKGGRHPTGKALRYLFASGILKGSGSGKHREVGYSRKRAGRVTALRKRGLATNTRKGFARTGQNEAYAKSGRHVFGSKSAHLQSGRGGRKIDHTATRATRIAAGRAIANKPEVARKALKGSGLTVRASKESHIPNMFGQSHGPLNASGRGTRLQGDTRFLVQTARKMGSVKPRWSKYGATRAERIDAGRMEAAYQVHRLAYKHKATATALDSAKRGMALMANGSHTVQRMGFGEVKSAAAAVQRMQRKERRRRRTAL